MKPPEKQNSGPVGVSEALWRCQKPSEGEIVALRASQREKMIEAAPEEIRPAVAGCWDDNPLVRLRCIGELTRYTFAVQRGALVAKVGRAIHLAQTLAWAHEERHRG